MLKRSLFGGLAVAGLLLTGAAPAFAAHMSPQSKSCWARADQQGLKGTARVQFHATCMKGAMAPTQPTHFDDQSASAKAITAPSGADRTTRSNQCSAEADKRGYKESTRDSFRRACLASAAPVEAIGVQTTPTAPTAAKDNLGTLPAPHPN